MRKLAVAGLALALVLGATACGGDDDDDGNAGSGGGGGSIEAFCDKARQYDDQSSEEVSDEEALAALRDVREDAPDDLRDDIDALLDFAEKVSEAGDDPEAQAQLLEDTADVEEASTNFSNFLADECGIASEE